MEKALREPISALTHFIGFLIGIPILVTMVMKASKETTPFLVGSLAVFGVSLLLLYGASTIYHAVKLPAKYVALLRRIDHMMIFILIAGTYTPICLVPLNGKGGWTLLVAVWGIAIVGIVLKAVWFNSPRWLSTFIYVLMGWLVIVAFLPLEKAVPKEGILLLVAGGITYTLGAVIYAFKWPKFNFKHFGFHEIFHLFVMGGSFFHILFMYQYIL